MKPLAVLALALAALAMLAVLAPARAEGPPPGDPATVKLFKAQCATCHGLDGKGNTTAGKKAGVKDWTAPKVLTAMSDADIEKQIRTGTTKDGKELMPSFAKLGDAKIDALAEYIRAFQPK